MSDDNTGVGDGGGIFFLIAYLWALYYTVFDPMLWGWAASLAAPFDVLAKMVVLVAAILGAVYAIIIAALFIIALFGIGAVVAKSVST